MRASPLAAAALAAALVSSAVHTPSAAAPASPSRAARPADATTFDYARRIDANNLNMFVSNRGWYAYDMATGSAGLYYPKGEGKTAVFAAGLWLGAQVQGQPRVTVAEYSPEYGPGGILPTGAWDNRMLPEHKVYKVARYTGNPQDTAHVERTPEELAADPTADPIVHLSWSEYMNGAVPHGAPVKVYRMPDPGNPSDSVDVPGPDVRGDQMLWSVYNDADPSLHTNPAGDSSPLDVEVQQTTFAFNQPGALANTVFMEWKIIHPGVASPPPGTAFGDTLTDMYVGLWMDPDVGDPSDDLVGCDTTLGLGYCYNATNSDFVYGSSPPAVGIDLLQGPQPLPAAEHMPLPTAFTKYIGGTDPAAPLQSYCYMQGLDAGCNPIINPVTGEPTTFMHSGDPVAGTGWLDTNPADKRMQLSAGPFTMVPGNVQVIVAAIVVARGSNRLASVTGLRLYDSQVQSFFDTAIAPPDTTPPQPTDACPRRATYWAGQCPDGSGTGLTSAQLDSVAARVDALSRFFDWPGGARAGFCGVVAPVAPTDLRVRAKQEYAALLANLAAGLVGTSEANGDPIFLNAPVPVSCPGVPAASVGELLALPDSSPPHLLSADYVNDDPEHRTALEGVDWGGACFNGGADVAFIFFQSSLDPSVMPDSFATVEIRFSHTATQKAYRYLRFELADGSAPLVGRAYAYGGYVPCNFQVWDAAHDVQLDAAFVERCVVADDGTIQPPASQPASFDSTWLPTADATGGREYLLVARTPYSDTPKAVYTADGAVLEPLSWLYALWARLRAADDVIDDGDRFVYTWGAQPDTTFETLMATLEGQSLGDPAVAARYQQIVTCFSAINAGDIAGTVCHAATPVLVSLVSAQAAADRVELVWHVTGLGSLITLERGSGGTWSALATLSADGSELVRYTDRAVEPGSRYGYRLRVGGLAGPLGEVWVEVPATLRLALAGLRPNPATSGAAVSFTLPVKAPATLELVDVAGRRVLAREVGGLGPGSHVVDLDGAGRVPAGLYFIRLRQGAGSVTVRGIILR